jgi:hypothetical protein
MRRAALSAVLVSLIAAPAGAGQILYTTVASKNRVEAYCLESHGGMHLDPRYSVETVENPRRLVVKDDVLYVAGRTRVESFRIRPEDGSLERQGKTTPLDGANVLDFAVNDARTHVYIPRRSQGRIEAHPLDANGGLTGAPFSSCAATSANVILQDVEVVGGAGTELLYATEQSSPFVAGKSGRIDVFALVDGELPDPPTSFRCDPKVTTTTSTSTSSTTITTNTTTNTTSTTSTTIDDRITPPLSTRKKLRAPGPFALLGDFIYVFDQWNRNVGAWHLENGVFTDEKQPRDSKTGQVGQFFDLVGVGSTLIGSQFEQGRARAFALKPNAADGDALTALPKQPQRTTLKIVESTPVRITTAEFCLCPANDTACEAAPPEPPCPGESQTVLYVSGGESFRIHAYRFKETTARDGTPRFLPETTPFSQTQPRQGSFPNDVAIARNVTCP